MNVHFMESATVNSLMYESHKRGDEFVDALYFVPLFNSRMMRSKATWAAVLQS